MIEALMLLDGSKNEKSYYLLYILFVTVKSFLKKRNENGEVYFVLSP